MKNKMDMNGAMFPKVTKKVRDVTATGHKSKVHKPITNPQAKTKHGHKVPASKPRGAQTML